MPRAARSVVACRRTRLRDRILEVGAHVADVPPPLPHVLLEAAPQQRRHRRRQRRGGSAVQSGLAVQHRGQRVGHGRSREGHASAQEFVEHAAERPDVGALVDRLARAPAPGSCRRRVPMIAPASDGDRRRRRRARPPTRATYVPREAEVQYLDDIRPA